ncbi:hypothetical protein KY346_01570 [Candidatus Woesearchaeota archaeon]|nr:hypothetical protein [Candidatus Woesearchaeota archaeon]
MDLQKGLPLTILAVVAVLSVVGLVMMYNSGTTGLAVKPSMIHAYTRTVIEPGQEKAYQIPAWGHAIKAVRPSKPCHILTVTGEQYSAKDVPAYLSAEEFNDLNKCYPYFDIYATNTDQVCCVI